MPNDTLLHVRIDPKIKAKAEKIFKRLGMSHSDAVRIFYSQAVEEKGMPFVPHIPNAETRKALEDSTAGRVEYTSMAGLRKMWNET